MLCASLTLANNRPFCVLLSAHMLLTPTPPSPSRLSPRQSLTPPSRPRPPTQTSGNFGILDIQLALRWVQDNAAGFGGDKSRVTVIGQSSGGTNIMALLASPASRGLFSATISLSGSPNITMDLPSAERQGRQFVNNTDCAGASDVMTCLHALTAEQVAVKAPNSWNFAGNAMPSKGASPNALPPRPGLVIVDGVTVSAPLLDGFVVDVPVILQTMATEDDIEPDITKKDWTTGDFNAFVLERFAPWGHIVASGIASQYAMLAQERGGEYAYYALGKLQGCYEVQG
jgi:hypothetical protein